MTGGPITEVADVSRDLPATSAERIDRVAAALASLRDEQRRCERLGFEIPLARCQAQRRYWEFLGGLFALEPARRLK